MENLKQYYIGADMGTTNIKVCAYNVFAEELASASRRCDTRHADDGTAEQMPEQWWECFSAALREVAAALPGQTCRSICISSHTPALVAIDENGKSLFPAMIWQDSRAAKEAEVLNREYGELLKHNNSTSVTSYHFIAKLLWFRNHYPALYDACWKYLEPKDYLNLKLTGKVFLDQSQSCLNHFYDIKGHCLDDQLINAIDPALREKLPEVVEPEACIGTVLPEIAARLGINDGVRVYAGGIDSCAAALGSNVYECGAVSMSLGTGANVFGCCELETLADLDATVSIVRHARRDLYLPMYTISNAGNTLDWFFDKVADIYHLLEKESGESRYDLLFHDVETVPPGSNGVIFLPYLAGETAPIRDPSARGCFFRLGSDTNRAEMGRAVLEGMCFALRHTLETFFEKVRIEHPSVINVYGGQTRQPLWMQMLADVLNMPVLVYGRISAAPRGNAIVGILDLNPNMQPADFCGEKTVYQPTAQSAEIYQVQFQRFKELYIRLRGLF